MGVVEEARVPSARDWAVAHDRRVHAARVARRLQPAAELLGGYASSRLRVRLGSDRERRPAAALAVGEPPADGVTRVAPFLVVGLAPADPAYWLAAGTTAVWVLGAGTLVVHREGQDPTALGPDADVAVPGAEGVWLPVRALLPKAHLLEGTAL